MLAESVQGHDYYSDNYEGYKTVLYWPSIHHPMQDKSQTDIQAAKPDDTKQTDTQDKQDDLDLGQFKNTKDLLKSYKEIQGWATRISQENKAYKDEIAHLKDQVELGRSSTFSPPPQAQSQTSTISHG